MNKRILIIADSTAMPRIEVPYEDTWIFLLKKKYPEYDIIDRSSRGATSRRLISEGNGGIDLLEIYKPDIVILQIGMVEAAPRLFRKKGLEFFFMNKILSAKKRSLYIDYIKKRRVRSPLLTESTPETFKKNISSYFDRVKNNNSEIIIIPILPATDLYIKKSPFIENNIKIYNNIFVEAKNKYSCINIAEPFRKGIDINKLCVDELHLNKEGSLILYNEITKHI